MPLAGQRLHIKEHARHIKSRNWRITVTKYRSLNENLVLVNRVKQATYLKALIRISSVFKCQSNLGSPFATKVFWFGFVFCQSGKFFSSLVVNVRPSHSVIVN